MVIREEVEKLIRSNPEININKITEKLKCDKKSVGNAIVGLKGKGIKIVGECTGHHKTRSVNYTIVDRKLPYNRTVTPSVVSNPIDSIKPKGLMPANQIISTFSDADRNQYFNLLEKAQFNLLSAELLINARRERLLKEREVIGG